MDLQQSVDAITKIESRFDVNTLRASGVRIWPIIRLSLFSYLVFGHPGVLSQKTTKSIRSRIRDNSKGARMALRGWLRAISPKRGQQAVSPKLDASKADVLFWSRPADHRATVNDLSYDIIVDPLVELIPDGYSYGKWEAASSGPATQRRFPTNFLQTGNLRFTGPDFLESTTTRAIKQLNRVLQEVVGISVDSQKLLATLQNLASIRDSAVQLLEAVQPRLVMFACYYDPKMMGMVWACQQRGIPCVDVQHGKQGRFHGAYSHWSSAPDDGYELLPDWFWCWGKESQENIQSHLPEGCQGHRTVVGGNQWLGKWKSGSPDVCGAEPDFPDEIRQAGKTVLLSLQPVETPLPKFVIEAMRRTPDWLWLVRLHPAQLRESKLEVFRAELSSAGIQNVELDFANTVSLYTLLKKCDHHITGFSSVCYEALAFETPTTLVHPYAETLYAAYIEEGLFDYASDTDGLVATMNSPSANKLGEQTPYIETSPQTGLNTLKNLLGDT